MDCLHYYPKEFRSYDEYVKYLKAKGFAVDAQPPMNKEHINSLGQRAVEVAIGYKVYGSEEKDSVILRVGDMHNGKYIYKDMQPVTDDTNEVCFMSETVLESYERAVKLISSASSFSDDEKDLFIKVVNMDCGLTGKYINNMCREIGLDPVEFFENFFG
jgi:hypothetical protein